jgi:hypothetical protein
VRRQRIRPARKLNIMILYFRLISLAPISNLTKIELRKRLINRKYDKLIRAAREHKLSAAKIEELQRDRYMEWSLEDEQADLIVTRQLTAKARRLRVPIPPTRNSDGTESEFWQEGNFLGHKTLAPAGIVTIREEIRKEQRWRAERRNHVISWIPAVTGLIGALTGLVALIRIR